MKGSIDTSQYANAAGEISIQGSDQEDSGCYRKTRIACGGQAAKLRANYNHCASEKWFHSAVPVDLRKIRRVLF